MTTIDKILVGCAVFLLTFTVTMIILFCIFQSTPDTLIDAVFGLLGGEVVVTFFIWWIKKRYSNRKAKKDEQAQ